MTSEEYLTQILTGFVDFPEEIRIDRSTDDMGILLSLHVSPKDMGKVIGKEGATAKAIRHIMRNIAFKNGEKVAIKVIEPVRN